MLNCLANNRNMEKFNEESALENPEAQNNEFLEILKNRTKEIKERQSKLPLDDEGRIDLNAYKEIYSSVEEDWRKVQEKEKEFTPKNDIEKHQADNGEIAELVTLTELYKFLHQNYYVARASRFDDIFRHVDTIIINNITGEIVCTIDETSAYKEELTNAKIEKLHKNNLKGVDLKYAFKIEKEKSIPHLILSSAEEVPVFCLFLGTNEINDNSDKIKSSDLDNISDFDKQVFYDFINIINKEIESIERYTQQVSLTSGNSRALAKAKKFVSNVSEMYPEIFNKNVKNLSK